MKIWTLVLWLMYTLLLLKEEAHGKEKVPDKKSGTPVKIGKNKTVLFSLLKKDTDKCECGVNFYSHGEQYFDGEPSPNEFPWMVGLCFKTARPFCGAALVNDRYVVTVAHCVKNHHPDQLSALIAEHDYSTSDESPAFRVWIQKILAHPGYTPGWFYNDIALVKLKEDIIFTPFTLPACFPRPDIHYGGIMGVVTGWGKISIGGAGTQKLHKVKTLVTTMEECRRAYGQNVVHDDTICAFQYDETKDACEGDSGGPLVWQHKRRWYLIGLLSWGYGCSKQNRPTVYVRVDKFYKWINDNTEDAKFCSD